jgi:uncharacterized protein
MIFIKLHKSYRDVVAVCDSNLMGKKFEEGIKQLDCRESFYQGKEYDMESAVHFLQLQAAEDATFNIIGPNAIKASLEAGIIKESGVMKVDGVPFALVLL